MPDPAIASAAGIIVEARLAGRVLEAFEPALGITTVELGYRVQQTANDLLERRLGARVGHKIGGTNKAMQVYLGCDEPLGGEVFQSTLQPSGASLRFGEYRRPGIETEIAVRLARPLPPRERPYTRDEVAAAVSEVMPAIELVDDRYRDFRTVGAPVIVADNAFNAGSILGRGRPLAELARPLDKLSARTFIDGRLVAEGVSDALLGHPLEALRWLANRRSSLGLGLAAGTFVSLGSITPVQWLEGPGRAEIEIGGLGEVQLVLH